MRIYKQNEISSYTFPCTLFWSKSCTTSWCLLHNAAYSALLYLPSWVLILPHSPETAAPTLYIPYMMLPATRCRIPCLDHWRPHPSGAEAQEQHAIRLRRLRQWRKSRKKVWEEEGINLWIVERRCRACKRVFGKGWGFIFLDPLRYRWVLPGVRW